MKVKAIQRSTGHNSQNVNRHSSKPFFGKSDPSTSKSDHLNVVQPKLNVGKKDDKYEREADSVADNVVENNARPVNTLSETSESMHMDDELSSSVQRAPTIDEIDTESVQLKEDDVLTNDEISAGESDVQLQQMTLADEDIQEKENEEEVNEIQKTDKGLQKQNSQPEDSIVSDDLVQANAGDMLQHVITEEVDDQSQEEEVLQSKSDEEIQAKDDGTTPSQVAMNPEQKLRATKGMGSPLSNSIRKKMESDFNADFSNVRIHTDDIAILLSKAYQAQAFTFGNDVYFGEGKYSPNSRDGQHLLAHELTHTIQQGHSEPNNLRMSEEHGEVQRKEKEDETSYLVRPELLKAVGLARGEIGKVEAKAEMPDGTRKGWETLHDYFYTAYGNKDVIHKSLIKKKTKPKDVLQAWCGIFTWWAYKKAGIPMPDWKIGAASILDKTRPRRAKEMPRKGDLAYDHMPYQHYAMVAGVESPETAAGKPFDNIEVTTINGNTAGDNNLGGEVQEKTHTMSHWDVFYDPVGKLDMPPVELVRTSVEVNKKDGLETDTFDKDDKDDKDIEPDNEEKAETIDESKEESGDADSGVDAPVPIIAIDEAPPDTSEVVVDLPPAAALPAAELVAKVEAVSLEGSSEKATVSYTESSPSQMAVTFPSLGSTMDSKVATEKQDEVNNAPALKVETSGEVKEGLTPPDQLGAPADAEISEGLTESSPGELVAEPYVDNSTVPSNKKNLKLVEDKKEEGFLDWFKNNIKSFLRNIKITDNSINTSAGEKKRVALEGDANPNRTNTQRKDADSSAVSQRDIVADNIKNNPGQQNIQPQQLNEEKSVALSPEVPVSIEATEDEGAKEYASAPLPADVRGKADELLTPSIDANMSESKTKVQNAATTRDADKNTKITTAKAEAKKISEDADNEQRNIVIENRTSVTNQQKQGIQDAQAKMNDFRTDIDKKQKKTHKDVDTEVKSKEGEADTELKKGETKAEDEKIRGNKEAKEKKEKLEKEKDNESWWDKGVNLVKKAVKFVTDAIDKVFTAVRKAVKGFIDAAKEAAVKLINKARDFVVGALNTFRDLAKGVVNTLLKKHFPELAKKINDGIDVVVDVAITGVNFVADKAIAGVEALANGLAAALDKILSVYQTLLKAAVQIIGAVITGDFAEALKIAIQAGCDIAGIDSKPIFDFFNRAGKQIKSILKAPGEFFNNLVGAVGAGARNFVKNIKKHLINGLIAWLTGALSEVAITLPEKFDAKGIFSLAMQILGLTYSNIKARVIKKFPAAAKVFTVVEKSFAIVKKLVTEGPAALWEDIKKSIGNFKEMVLSGIRTFVITTVVKEAVTWLLGLLNPAGALVKILKLLFDFVMFIVDRFQQIKDFVMSIYSTLAALAAGQFGVVVKAVEDAMARSLPVIIGMLASLAGLGGIGKTVQKIIKKISAPVNKLLDKIIDKIIKFAKKLFKKGKSAAKKIKDKVIAWWKVKKKFKADDGNEHNLFLKGKGASAKLTVRSEERTYDGFLQWAKGNDVDKAELKKASDAAKMVDAKKKEPFKTDKKNKEARKKEEEKRKVDLDGLVGNLAKATKPLFVGDKDIPETTNKGLTLPGKNGSGYGVSMVIKPLTNKRGSFKGSSPDTAAHPNYDAIDLRGTPSGSTYYIRGHLLNEKLGGKGKWNNMTPLSRSGNAQHSSQVETFVKNAVDSGAIMKYSVKPTGNYPATAESVIADFAQSRSDEDVAKMKKIAANESGVPKTLGCSASLLKITDKDKFVTEKTKTWSVPNKVEQGEGDYFLKNGGKKVQRVEINLLTGPGLLTQDGFPQSIKGMAENIVAAVKSRKDKGESPFTRYETLAKESGAANQGEFTAELQKWGKRKFIKLG